MAARGRPIDCSEDTLSAPAGELGDAGGRLYMETLSDEAVKRYQSADFWFPLAETV